MYNIRLRVIYYVFVNSHVMDKVSYEVYTYEHQDHSSNLAAGVLFTALGVGALFLGFLALGGPADISAKSGNWESKPEEVDKSCLEPIITSLESS